MSALKCPGAEKIRASFPDEISCACGLKVEMWPDDTAVHCPGCGRSVRREAPPACIEWCTAARECVGDDLYTRYMRGRENRMKPKRKGGAR